MPDATRSAQRSASPKLTEVRVMLADRVLTPDEVTQAKVKLQRDAGARVVAVQAYNLTPGDDEGSRTMLLITPVCPVEVLL